MIIQKMHLPHKSTSQASSFEWAYTRFSSTDHSKWRLEDETNQNLGIYSSAIFKRRIVKQNVSKGGYAEI